MRSRSHREPDEVVDLLEWQVCQHFSDANQRQLSEQELERRKERLHEQVAKTLHPVIHGFVSRSLGLRHGRDADDVAQDSIMLLIRKLPTYNPKTTRLSTYALILARYQVLEHFRKLKKAPVLDSEVATQSPTLHSDVAAQTDVRRKVAAVDAYLHRELDEKTRTIFILHHFGQIPYAEIAAVVGVKVGTVKSSISRTIDKLKVALGDLEKSGGHK